MNSTETFVQSPLMMDLGALGRLIESLRRRDYRVVGPTIRNGAIVYDELRTADDLPVGWTDEQDGGNYRLVKRSDQARFGFNVGPHSWKKFLHPPEVRLWRAERQQSGFTIHPEKTAPPRHAFLGVQACELKAIRIQDKVFLDGDFRDSVYEARRAGAFIVAVQCAQAGGTCFCASMNAGPAVDEGHNVALTEVIDEDRHYFVAQAGSKAGAEVLAGLSLQHASQQEADAGRATVERASKQMGRSLDTNGVRELLADNTEHPRWEQVAKRCLACANCTMVCPTCFCSTVEDTTDLSGDHAERWRKWDSCFTMDFSYIHGGSVRTSTMARYRQWLTHKLSTWIDQFGVSGCVGCGRCITWCPVGIDLTEEVAAIRDGNYGVS